MEKTLLPQAQTASPLAYPHQIRFDSVSYKPVLACGSKDHTEVSNDTGITKRIPWDPGAISPG